MNLPNQYRRVHKDDVVSDGVKVTIFEVAGQPADLIWHRTVRRPGGAEITPKANILPAGRALDGAIERLFELRPFGFQSIVVRLEQDDLWNYSWGELIEWPDAGGGLGRLNRTN